MVAKKLLSKTETAEFFGVSTQTLDNWRDAGILKPVKVGRRVYYTAESINEVLTPKTSDDE